MDVASLVVKVSTDGANKAQSELDKLAKQSLTTEKATNALTSSLKAMGGITAAITFASLIKESIQLADTYKLTEGRLSLVTKGYQELISVQNELLKVSQNTRQSYNDTIDLYTRIARSTQQLGKSQSDIIKVTDSVNKALVISGSSAESSKAAIIQLGQALSSGKLQGDELRSILENAPRLAEAIAKGMNTTIGALRDLGAQGKLTSEDVFNAIMNQGNAIDSEFGKMPMTVEQSLTTVKNSITVLIGEFDKATGATSALADEFRSFSKMLDKNSTDLIATWQFVSATASRTIDVFNLLYETVENTGKIVVGNINLLAYGSLEVILTMLTKVTEGMNLLGIASDKGLQEAYADLANVHQLVVNANNLIADSYKEIDDAVLKLSPTIEDRIKEYNRLKQSAIDAKKEQVNSLDLEDRFTRSTAIPDSYWTEQYKKYEKQIKDSEQLAKEWADKRIEIANNISIAEQDKLAEPYIKLTAEYEKDLEHFKGNKEAQLMLTANYNAQVQRLNSDTAQKAQEEEQKAQEKAQRERDRSIQKELKLQEENFRIQARQVELLDDEADKQVALATLEYQRTQASLKAQMQLGEISPAYYDAMMEAEDKLLAKQKQNWTMYGQIINNTTGAMENSFMDFFDATSEGYRDLGVLAKSILKEMYQEALRVALVKPLVGAATSAMMSGLDYMFGGGTTTASTASTYDISSGGSLTNAYFKPNAKGGAYSSPSLSQYSGQIVDKPTFFAFANGGAPNAGVMGEAGSEAILPLTRTSSGNLGVEASGVGAQTMKIQIINESGTQMEVTKTSQTTDVEGMVIQAWISGISKNRYGSRDMLGGR